MKFVFNDGGRSNYFKAENVGDCGVRAVANATGLDYKKVYDDLKALNKGKSCRDGTPRKVMAKYMEQLGWTWTPTMGIGTGCKVHLREDELPKGNLVLSLSGHFSCVRDGVLYDTYDCSRDGTRCVYGYWKEPERKPLFTVVRRAYECVVEDHNGNILASDFIVCNRMRDAFEHAEKMKQVLRENEE